MKKRRTRTREALDCLGAYLRDLSSLGASARPLSEDEEAVLASAISANRRSVLHGALTNPAVVALVLTQLERCAAGELKPGTVLTLETFSADAAISCLLERLPDIRARFAEANEWISAAPSDIDACAESLRPIRFELEQLEVAVELVEKCYEALIGGMDRDDREFRAAFGFSPEVFDKWRRGVDRLRQAYRESCWNLACHSLFAVVQECTHLGRRDLDTRMSTIEECAFSLLLAAKNFRLGMGARFDTYARWWIKRGIKENRRRNGRNVFVPAYILELRAKLSRDTQRNTETLEETAARYGIEPKTLKRALGVSDVEVSFGEQPSNELRSNQRTPLSLLIREEQRRIASKRMIFLDALQKAAIAGRFPSFGESKTLKQIGEELGLTRERIRQIEKEALEILRFGYASE